MQLEHDIAELKKRAREDYLAYLDSLEKIPEIPGAIELIKYCHEMGYKIGLASSAGPKRIELFLKKLNIAHYFDVTVSGDDVEKSKPEPGMFLLAAQKLGVNPSDCVVVEDAETGVRAAKSAGMKCIAYYGSEHNLDDLLAADMIVNDFHALVRGLKSGELPV